MKLEIMVAERPQGPMGPHAGRAHGALKDPRDLRERELLQSRKQEHLPVGAVEAAERPLQEGVVIASGRRLVGAARLVRMELEVAGVDR